MKLSGSLISKGKQVNNATIVCNDPKIDFHGRLEYSLIEVCKELKISVPIWLKKNTKELAMCKKTSFFEDQFSDEISFERFEIRIDKI